MGNRNRFLSLTALALSCGLAAPAAAGSQQGYLGATLALYESQAESNSTGVYIVGIAEGSGAHAAGLTEDDRIVTIGKVAVKDLADVDTALEGVVVGERILVRVVREDGDRTVDVTLGARPVKTRVKVKQSVPLAFVVEGSPARLGVRTQTLEGQLATYFGVENGVLITHVEEDGPAWHADLRAGDVLVGWNGRPVPSARELNAVLLQSESGDVVDLDVRREDRLLTLPITLAEGNGSENSVTLDLAFEVETGEDDPKGKTPVRVLVERIPQD